MNPDPDETEGSEQSSQDYVLGLRYSLPQMLAEIRTERVSGSYSMEKLDQKEIGKMFKPQKRRRAKTAQ